MQSVIGLLGSPPKIFRANLQRSAKPRPMTFLSLPTHSSAIWRQNLDGFFAREDLEGKGKQTAKLVDKGNWTSKSRKNCSPSPLRTLVARAVSRPKHLLLRLSIPKQPIVLLVKTRPRMNPDKDVLEYIRRDGVVQFAVFAGD